jgi:hypothetical protein
VGKELHNIITEKFLQCIPFKHDDYPNSIFYGIDKQVTRQKKLNRILGKNDEIIIDKPSKDIEWQFEQDKKNKYFCVDYDNLWSFFVKNYGYNNQEIRELFDGWLKDTEKFKQYTTTGPAAGFSVALKDTEKITYLYFNKGSWLKDTEKFKQYLTSGGMDIVVEQLKDTDKLKQYSTRDWEKCLKVWLKDTDKLKQYTITEKPFTNVAVFKDTDKFIKLKK